MIETLVQAKQVGDPLLNTIDSFSHLLVALIAILAIMCSYRCISLSLLQNMPSPHTSLSSLLSDSSQTPLTGPAIPIPIPIRNPNPFALGSLHNAVLPPSNSRANQTLLASQGSTPQSPPTHPPPAPNNPKHGSRLCDMQSTRSGTMRMRGQGIGSRCATSRAENDDFCV